MLASPSVAITGLQAIAAEYAGNQVAIGNQHELAHGGDHIGGWVVPLTAAALGQAHLAVHAADPVNDENDLGGCVVDIATISWMTVRATRFLSRASVVGAEPDRLKVRRR
jgi:hypothetical protein